jgi:branched-chain amino acid transport system permease protein
MIMQLINGLMLGGLYSLITLGYALVLGILGIFNMAHAEIFMCGAVLGWLAITVFKLPLIVAIVIVVVGGALLGLATEYLCVRRSMLSNSFFVPIATTTAFGLILQNLVANLAGSNPLPITTSFQYTQVTMLGSSLPLTNIIVFVASIVILVLLALYLKKTRIGLASRAVGGNREIVELLGINATSIVQITFAVSGVIGALSGLLFGIMAGAAQPFMGDVAGLKGICLVIIGGMGSLPGAVIAALLGGIAEVLTGVYWSTTYADGVLWLIMFIILVFRPVGLMGKKEQMQRLQ